MTVRGFRFSVSLLALLGASAMSFGSLASMAHAQQAAAPAAAQSTENKVLARVDGAEITEQDLALASEELSERLPAMADAQKRDYLIGYLIDIHLGAKAAEQAQLAETDDFKRRLAYSRDKVLVDEYLASVAQKAATEEEARKLYDETIKSLPPEEEVHARHILVTDENEAKAVIARLEKGEDFAKLAAELSKDPGSAKEGGDLGYFTRDRMVPEFSETAFKLEKGKVSAPIKTQFGWHVLKVEDKRAKAVPTFEEVREQIDTFIVQKAQQDAILALREKAKIERLDKPATPPAPAEGAAPAPAPANDGKAGATDKK